MEEALMSLLLGNGAVTARLGTRVYWGRAPQKKKGGAALPRPYAVMRRITGLRDYHMQGDSGYVESRVQIDVYDERYKGALLASRSVVAALSGFRGTVSGTRLQGIFIDSERDLPAADAGEVTHLFRTSVDIIVHHSE